MTGYRERKQRLSEKSPDSPYLKFIPIFGQGVMAFFFAPISFPTYLAFTLL